MSPRPQAGEGRRTNLPCMGRIPTVQEHLDLVNFKIAPEADNIYRHLNFDRMEEYRPHKIIKLTQV